MAASPERILKRSASAELHAPSSVRRRLALPQSDPAEQTDLFTHLLEYDTTAFLASVWREMDRQARLALVLTCRAHWDTLRPRLKADFPDLYATADWRFLLDVRPRAHDDVAIVDDVRVARCLAALFSGATQYDITELCILGGSETISPNFYEHALARLDCTDAHVDTLLPLGTGKWIQHRHILEQYDRGRHGIARRLALAMYLADNGSLSSLLSQILRCTPFGEREIALSDMCLFRPVTCAHILYDCRLFSHAFLVGNVHPLAPEARAWLARRHILPAPDDWSHIPESGPPAHDAAYMDLLALCDLDDGLKKSYTATKNFHHSLKLWGAPQPPYPAAWQWHVRAMSPAQLRDYLIFIERRSTGHKKRMLTALLGVGAPVTGTMLETAGWLTPYVLLSPVAHGIPATLELPASAQWLLGAGRYLDAVFGEYLAEFYAKPLLAATPTHLFFAQLTAAAAGFFAYCPRCTTPVGPIPFDAPHAVCPRCDGEIAAPPVGGRELQRRLSAMELPIERLRLSTFVYATAPLALDKHNPDLALLTDAQRARMGLYVSVLEQYDI